MVLTSHGSDVAGVTGGQGSNGMVGYGNAASAATCLFIGFAFGLV